MAKDNKLVTSDYNLIKLNPSSLEETLKASIESGISMAVFGRRGTGKTQISKQVISDLAKHEQYANLSVYERVDMGGYPNMMKDSKFVDFRLPAFYEKMIEGDKPVVALLDEVDKADPSLWAPLLEFVQFKSINGTKLPNLKCVIMTGNLISEGGNKPCLPLLDRTAKFLVEPDVSSWLKWSADRGKIHSSITAYINDNGPDLYGDVDPDSSYADPSPRSWELASNAIKFGEANNWSPHTIINMVSGCIGNSIGLKYKAYFDHYQKIVPFVNKVFKGENVKKEYDALKPTEQMVACMQTCARLCVLIDQYAEASGKTRQRFMSVTPVKIPEDLDKALTNTAKFLDITSPEIFLIGFRTQITIKKLIVCGLDEHPEFSKVIEKVRKQIKE